MLLSKMRFGRGVYTQVLGNPALRAGAVLVLLGAFPGCTRLPGGTAETVEIDAIFGETMEGELNNGQTLRADTVAEADHIYAVQAGLAPATSETTVSQAINGTVSGPALAEPVEFPVATSTGGTAAPELTRVFLAQADGRMTVQFAFAAAAETAELTAPALQTLRELIRGSTQARYELLLVDLGLDDNGTVPEEAVPLAVGLEGERLGTIIPGDEGDYFLVEVRADLTYELRLESTDAVDVTSGSMDRFAQVNFGVATPGGLLINVNASAGTPGTTEFTAAASEQVWLRLTALNAGGAGEVLSAPTISYSISIVQVVPEGE